MVKKAPPNKAFRPRGKGTVIFSCSIDKESGDIIKSAQVSPSFIFQLGYRSWKSGVLTEGRDLVIEALYQRFLAYVGPGRDEGLVLKWLDSDFFTEERAKLGAMAMELRVLIQEKLEADEKIRNNKYLRSILGLLKPTTPPAAPTHPRHKEHTEAMAKKFIESQARDAEEQLARKVASNGGATANENP